MSYYCRPNAANANSKVLQEKFRKTKNQSKEMSNKSQLSALI